MPRWLRRLETLVLVGGLLALLGWFAFPRAPAYPNVLLITLDTTRADHLSLYGYPRQTTPTLDALARRSLVFDNAWAPMATTLPSHLTLMTSVAPLEHGVLANMAHGGRLVLPSETLQPVAGVFADAGWMTGAFVSAPPVKRGTGIERGFATFVQPERVVRRAKPTTESALAWLDKHGEAPFFAWVHYYDPHGPFDPPGPHRVFEADATLEAWMADRAIPERSARAGGAEIDPRAAHDAYDGEIHYVDAQIARLLALIESRQWHRRTVVVVVGDHGEGLGQHDIGGHGHVWREQLQVPLIIHVPWWWRSRQVHTQVAMADVMPMVLGIVRPVGWRGFVSAASGRDVLSGVPSGPALGLSSLRQEALAAATESSLTAGGWRVVTTGQSTALFHLGSDPHERHDLSATLPVQREVLARLAIQAADAQRARGRILGTGGETQADPADVEALKALGYLDGG